MGMLAYGAMSGVGGEWLKQSDENRKNKHEAIRDKRLSELRKGEDKHRAELTTQENMRQEKWNAENYEHGMGDTVVRDGKVVHKGSFAPGKANDPAKSPIYLVSGDVTTQAEQRQLWATQAFTKDQFGNPVRNPEIAGFDEWFNERVRPEHRINPQNAKPEAMPEEDPSTADIQQARQEYNDQAKWTQSDQAQFGMSESEWVDKRSREIMRERRGGAAQGKGGLLSEAKTPKKAAGANSTVAKPDRDSKLAQTKQSTAPKVKVTLSQAAKTDPEQMFAELMDHVMENPDIGEEEVANQVRQFFGQPDWQIPQYLLE